MALCVLTASFGGEAFAQPAEPAPDPASDAALVDDAAAGAGTPDVEDSVATLRERIDRLAELSEQAGVDELPEAARQVEAAASVLVALGLQARLDSLRARSEAQAAGARARTAEERLAEALARIQALERERAALEAAVAESAARVQDLAGRLIEVDERAAGGNEGTLAELERSRAEARELRLALEALSAAVEPSAGPPTIQALRRAPLPPPGSAPARDGRATTQTQAGLPERLAALGAGVGAARAGLGEPRRGNCGGLDARVERPYLPAQGSHHLLTVFLFDKERLEPRPAELDRAARCLAALAHDGGWEFRLVGHTDDRGRAERNAELSLERAEQVRASLAERLGLPLSAVAVQGEGETYPMARNDSEGGRGLNRRVELFATEPAAGGYSGR